MVPPSRHPTPTRSPGAAPRPPTSVGCTPLAAIAASRIARPKLKPVLRSMPWKMGALMEPCVMAKNNRLSGVGTV